MNEEINGDSGATSEIVAEANSSKSAGMSLDVNEVAKKDSLTRRKELLIQSGLAEVCICPYFMAFCFVFEVHLHRGISKVAVFLFFWTSIINA